MHTLKDIIGKMTLEKLAQVMRDDVARFVGKIDQLSNGQSRFEEECNGLKKDHRKLEENFVGLKDYMDYRFNTMEGKLETKFREVSREFGVAHEEAEDIHRVIDRQSNRTAMLEKRVDMLEGNSKLSEFPA
jgi:SMC interacting uncharacterized protein involved in chromosome segregation